MTEPKETGSPGKVVTRWDRAWPRLVSVVGLLGFISQLIYPPWRDTSIMLVAAAVAQALPLSKLVDKVVK